MAISALKSIISVPLYAPNQAKEKFYEKFFQNLLGIHYKEIIILGDMNGVLEPNKDNSKKSKGDKLHKNVTHYMGLLHLIDVWRTFNPNSRNYTFFSDRHQTHSRIDMRWPSKTFLRNFKSVGKFPKMYADHNAILI